MPTYTYGRGSVEVDDKGYLVDFDQWNESIAKALAVDEGIGELTADHWAIIDFLREHQQEHGAAPMIRVLCRRTGMKLEKVYYLFPGGPAKCASRVAGLPRPDSCV